MAVAAGYGGSVVWAAAYADMGTNVHEWNLTYEAGEGETTDFSSSGPKTWIPLTTEWSGSFTVRLDSSTALIAVGTAATEIQLAIASAFGYKGDAFATSINPSQDVNGLPTAVVNFRGTGVLSVGSL